MKEEYREISPKLLKLAYENAWSIESMEAHGARGRTVQYIGSRVNGYLDNDRQNGNLVYDYYRDSAGAWWFKNRALLPSGEIVSMEMYILGHGKKWKRKGATQWKK